MKRRMHPDFRRIRNDFMDIRNGHEGEYLYARFLSEYGLNDSEPYEIVAQKKMQEYALRSPTHLAIKKQYPQIDWDFLVTRRKKADQLRIKADHSIRLKLRNIKGKSMKIRFGGEI